ncbi:hypothetical protein [Caballeronia choica]|uniref:hypothetical protein n=1 Tax=Caballeronia choica TaxID=326476 RepID=UPI000B3E6DA1|nr:hypothetical protein [Caballeronia choica]
MTEVDVKTLAGLCSVRYFNIDPLKRSPPETDVRGAIAAASGCLTAFFAATAFPLVALPFADFDKEMLSKANDHSA